MPRTAVLLAVATLIVVGAALPAQADAAYLLKPDGSYQIHNHAVKGANWHVQLIANKTDRRKLDLVLLYAARCQETITVPVARIDKDGAIDLSGKTLKMKGEKQGTWNLKGQLTAVWRFTGEWSIDKPGCKDGPNRFTAMLQPIHVHKDGTKHLHPAHSHGNGSYANLKRSKSPRTLRSLASLHRRTLVAAKRYFPSYDAAIAQGFTRLKKDWPRPLTFHVRSARYENDKYAMDPKRPESLVYWWPKKGKPILTGFMYRIDAFKIPEVGKGILQYHLHYNGAGDQGRSMMTHIWIARDLRAAAASCLPVTEINEYNPRFVHSPPAIAPGPESLGCPKPLKK